MKTDDTKQTGEDTPQAECDSVQRVVMQDRFETWWEREGLEITQRNMALDEDDTDNLTLDFVKRITATAWSNAEDCAVIF